MIQKAALLQALEDRHEPQSIFLLNSVFMAAAVTGECTHPSCYSMVGDNKSMGTPFFERARMVLDYCLGIPRVSTVQGLMMLSRYPKIAGLGHHFIQQAILMATELGLHRKCDRWIPDKQVQETRKRVFWCIYALDSSAASVTGRRPLIDNSEIDVPLVDPNATEGEFEYSNTLYLLHLCKLWRIFRNVKQFVFNAEDIQEMASGPGSLPKSYEQQLIQWQLQLPAALRFSFELDPRDPLAKYNARAGKFRWSPCRLMDWYTVINAVHVLHALNRYRSDVVRVHAYLASQAIHVVIIGSIQTRSLSVPGHLHEGGFKDHLDCKDPCQDIHQDVSDYRNRRVCNGERDQDPGDVYQVARPQDPLRRPR